MAAIEKLHCIGILIPEALESCMFYVVVERRVLSEVGRSSDTDTLPATNIG